MRKDEAKICHDFYYHFTRMAMMILCLALICRVVLATNDVKDVSENTPTTAVEVTSPSETEVPTEPDTQPTEPELPTEIPTEPPTEPPVTYYDIPLSEDLQNHIFQICEERAIDPVIILAMIKIESNYRPTAMGDNGNAYGLMQIHPRWHQARMNKLGVTDLLDPYQNVLVGIDYMGELLNSGGTKRSIEWALMAYNGGTLHAIKNTNAGIVTNYAKKVLQTIDILKGE